MRCFITIVFRTAGTGRLLSGACRLLRNLSRETAACQPRPVSKVLFLIVGSLLFTAPLAAQDIYFGQNKVQYKDFEWSVFKTEHFEFFYHQGGEEIADFAAVASELAYEDLRRAFRFELTQRVPIIIYNSHNDFQQTNVIPGILREGIGGFTEYLKHRVVVPFQGSYEDFRHVLHHELVHAVSMSMIHGTGIAGLISQAQSAQLPLWFVEGLAEYQSMGWDMEADAFMRDAVIAGYMPKLQDIYGGFLAYKGGQAFFHYLTQTYGSGRIADILSNLRMLNHVDRAFIAAVGKPIEELSEDWHRYLRRTYWPQIVDREMPDEFADPLTDHQEDGSTYNVFPALSPAGDKVAFISNRQHYMDLYIVSALDGKVLSRLGKGEQVSMFEEMHILRGGITWSPDGERVAVAAKGGRYDQIYIVDAGSGRVVQEINPELDGVFEPAWSPDGRRLAFVGIEEGYPDLYLYDLQDGGFTRLTDSKAGESTPAWSGDGSKLAYTS
ncbi:MAG: PD40 domain-containing protein, partial [Candidatus Latescibacteria bacterium]|nr:PD40 domain-containing protein [Candidatus Latescibacterota bacterium]